MTFARLCSVATAVTLALALAGCSFGEPEERDPYQPSIGSNERTPSTDALGVAIVVDGEGNGRVVGTLVNTTTEPQALVGADVVTERGPVRASVVDDRVALPPDEPVRLAREPAIAVSAEDLPEGLFVELILDVTGAEPIEMLVPVEPQEGPYSEIEVTVPPDGDVSP